MTNGSLMKVLGEFCNTFDLHEAIVALEKQFLVILRVAVLHRFLLYLSSQKSKSVFKNNPKI